MQKVYFKTTDMDFCEFEHIRKGLKDNIFKLYLNGFSIQEIRYLMEENMRMLTSIDEINDIIDYKLQTSFGYE